MGKKASWNVKILNAWENYNLGLWTGIFKARQRANDYGGGTVKNRLLNHILFERINALG
jgi:hypothetical protein